MHSKWLSRYEYLEIKANNSIGGIFTLWDPQKIGILDMEASRNYLSLIIQPPGDKESYMITNVYGPQKLEDKLKILTSLEELRERYPNIPWILVGDFNMIKSLTEKKGGTRTLGRDSIAFQNFINNMRLVDAETINGTFTWNNKRGGASQVTSKLDRFMISEDLFLRDPDMSILILPFGGSNHWPVQLEATFMGTPRNKPSRFEKVCLSHPDFTNNIDKWWTEELPFQGTKMFMLQQRLKHIKVRLKDWNKKQYGKRIFSRDKILKLKYSQGKELVTHKEMESILVQHFLSITNEPLLDRSQFINKFTRYIPKLVTREDNHNLNRPVSEYEVNEVINEMQNGKAPGPDGFNVEFFKSCWKTVKQDILEVVEDSRRSRSVLKALNASFITLIPKQEKAITLDRFRPIA
eukprot:PITA_10243